MVIQTVADYKGWMQDMVDKLPEGEVKECRCLEVEYFIMRTALVGVPQEGNWTVTLTALVMGRGPPRCGRAHVHQGGASTPVSLA